MHTNASAALAFSRELSTLTSPALLRIRVCAERPSTLVRGDLLEPQIVRLGSPCPSICFIHSTTPSLPRHTSTGPRRPLTLSIACSLQRSALLGDTATLAPSQYAHHCNLGSLRSSNRNFVATSACHHEHEIVLFPKINYRIVHVC